VAALADFEQLAREVDDPNIRLELAKLYEHHVKAFEQAIELVDQGIAEKSDAAQRRRARLQRKLTNKQHSKQRHAEEAANHIHGQVSFPFEN